MFFYPCFGFRPYSLWSNVLFSIFSTILLINEGKNFSSIQFIRELPNRSPGSPPCPTRPTTHAPLLVLRYTYRSGQHTDRCDSYTCHLFHLFCIKSVYCKAEYRNVLKLCTFSATLLVSTAMSPPEFPMPITTTLFPCRPSVLRYSQVWKYLPSKLSIPEMKKVKQNLI